MRKKVSIEEKERVVERDAKGYGKKGERECERKEKQNTIR